MQLRVEVRLDQLDVAQQLAEPLQRVVLALDRDEHLARRPTSALTVSSPRRRRAVDEHVVERGAGLGSSRGRPRAPGAAASRGRPARPARSRRRPGRSSPGTHQQAGESGRAATTSASGASVDQHVVDARDVRRGASTPSAVEALPCGSRSTTSTLQPVQRQRGGQVDRGRRLADAALLVRDGDDPGPGGRGERRPGRPAQHPDGGGRGRGRSGVSPWSVSRGTRRRGRPAATDSRSPGGVGRLELAARHRLEPARLDLGHVERAACTQPDADSPVVSGIHRRPSPHLPAPVPRSTSPAGASVAPAASSSSAALRPLERRAAAARAQQRQRPADQPVQAARPPGRSRRRPTVGRPSLLGPAADHLDRARPRSATTSLQEVDPAQQRLDQHDRTSGRSERQRRSRAARPRCRRRPPRRPAGPAAATTAQLSRCRSHSRGTSRGPISPRVDAGAGQPARRTARPAAGAAPKTAPGRPSRRRRGRGFT